MRLKLNLNSEYLIERDLSQDLWHEPVFEMNSLEVLWMEKMEYGTERKLNLVMIMMILLAMVLSGCTGQSDVSQTVSGSQNISSDTNDSERSSLANLTQDGKSGQPAEDSSAALSDSEKSDSVSGGTDHEDNNDKDGMAEDMLEQKARAALEKMSLEEKVAQLFIATPESLGGVDPVTDASQFQSQYNNLPVGGLIFFDKNFVDVAQTQAMLAGAQSFSQERLNLPIFLSCDEEGGTVARVANSGVLGIAPQPSAAELGASQDLNVIRQQGEYVGQYLHQLGFNVDFAPDADVITNPENTVLAGRTFSSDPAQVAQMALAFTQGLEAEHVLPVYKHFPGHGSTSGDTHDGFAYSNRTLEELENCDLIPFQTGIANGIPAIMVAHISLPELTGSDLPASLNPQIITDLLRKQMGYSGLIITDALNMGAVADHYDSREAVIRALQAGADMVLMPGDLYTDYEAVVNAVHTGDYPEAQLNDSVLRVLKAKFALQE